MGLSDGRKSFPIGLAVLIQYRSVTASQPPSQPPSHVAVAITLNALAKAPSLNINYARIQSDTMGLFEKKYQTATKTHDVMFIIRLQTLLEYCISSRNVTMAYTFADLRLHSNCDSSTIRVRFEHDSSTACYSTLRGFSCARIRVWYEHPTRIAWRRVIYTVDWQLIIVYRIINFYLFSVHIN